MGVFVDLSRYLGAGRLQRLGTVIRVGWVGSHVRGNHRKRVGVCFRLTHLFWWPRGDPARSSSTGCPQPLGSQLLRVSPATWTVLRFGLLRDTTQSGLSGVSSSRFVVLPRAFLPGTGSTRDGCLRLIGPISTNGRLQRLGSLMTFGWVRGTRRDSSPRVSFPFSLTHTALGGSAG